MNHKSDQRRNHLADEKSPYLLQHARNPVNWYPWNTTALKIAQDENKPIFVSIGYSTCHWCHVMAHESFEDQDVADRLNNDFVSIKVDREERPDIDTAFMQACQLLNRHGGWPLNLFLTPEGKPFYALTYAPKHGKGNQPGFMAIVEKIAELWNSRPDSLIEGGEQLSRAIEQMENQLSSERLDEKLLKSAADNFIQSFDNIHGGFGPAPKFPQPHNTTLLLRLAQRYDNAELHQMALKTLVHIESGGITDQLGGGLHRYSVDEKWLVPHFEKMLYDQALIAESYLDAWQVSHDERFRLAAEKNLDYVLRELRHPDGGFFCGEDADSEGSEGTYYLWTVEQLNQHLSPSEADLVSTIYNVTEKGNFEGSNILHRTPSDHQSTENITESLAELRMARSKLLQARNSRPHPHLDDKILTGWNGLMISAFARAGQLLHRDDYLDAACLALSFIRTNLIQDGTLKRRYRDGDTAIDAFHEDYAYLIHGLLDLFMVDNDPELLTFALHLTAQCKTLFSDAQGGYYDSATFFTEGMGRGRSRQDGAIPAAASVTAHNLIRLARLTGRSELEEQAGRILALHLPQADKYPTAFAYLLMALDLFLSQSFSLVIVAENKQISPEWQQLINQFRPTMPTFIVADEHNLSPIVPCTDGKQRVDNQTTAWLCTGSNCLPPVSEPSQLAKLLNDQIPLKTFIR